jgi:hypothetical protein
MNVSSNSNDRMCPLVERDDDEAEHASLIDEILRLERSTNAALRASRDEIQGLRDAADEKRAAVRRMEEELVVIQRAMHEGSGNHSIIGNLGHFMGGLRMGWDASRNGSAAGSASGSAAGSTAGFGSVSSVDVDSSATFRRRRTTLSHQHRQQRQQPPASPRALPFRRRMTVSGGDMPFFRRPTVADDRVDVAEVVGHGHRRISDPTLPRSRRLSIAAPDEDPAPRAGKTILKMSAPCLYDHDHDDDDIDDDDDDSTRRSSDRRGGGSSSANLRMMNLSYCGHRHHVDDSSGENNVDDNGDDRERIPFADRPTLDDDDDSDDDNRRGRGGSKGGQDHTIPTAVTNATATACSKNERIDQLMHFLQTTFDVKSERVAELGRRRASNSERLTDLKSRLGPLEARSRSRWIHHASVVEGLQWRKQTLTGDVEERGKLLADSERCLQECERRIEILEREIEVKTGGLGRHRAHSGEDCGGRDASNIVRLEGEIRLCRLRLQVHSQYTARALQSFSHVIEAAKTNDTDGILFWKRENVEHHVDTGSEGDEDVVEQRRQYLVEGIALDVDIQLNDLERMIKEIDSKINEYKSLSSMEMGPAASPPTPPGGAYLSADLEL